MVRDRRVRDRMAGSDCIRPERRSFRALPTVAMVVMLIVAACATPSFVAKQDPAVNFNGSFEIVEAGYPVNWSFSESPIQSGDMVISLDTEIVSDGQQSLKVEVLSAPEDKEVFYQVWAKPAFSARTPIEPGKTYRVSFWLRDLGAKVHVRWVTASSDYYEHFRHMDMLQVDEHLEEWRYAEDVVTVEEGESLLELIFVATSPGVFWCDDVKIEEANAAR